MSEISAAVDSSSTPSSSSSSSSTSTPPPPVLQQLYDIVCAQSTGKFTYESLHIISTLLGSLTPDHTGLKLPSGLDQQLTNITTSMNALQVKDKEEKQKQKQQSHQKIIHYQSVYLGQKFHMGIFLLPKGASIPLHDHPGMTVCTCILYGSVHLRAYQWVHRPKQSKGRLHGPARMVLDEIVTAPNAGAIIVKDDEFDADGKNITAINPRTPSIIECSNIHRITALTDTAMFDILLPPYSQYANRPCHNYRIHTLSKQSSYEQEAVDEKHVKNICEASRFRTSRTKSLTQQEYASSDSSDSDTTDPATNTRRAHPLVYLHQCSEPASQVIRPSRYLGTKIRVHDNRQRQDDGTGGDSDDDHHVGEEGEVMLCDDAGVEEPLEEGEEEPSSEPEC